MPLTYFKESFMIKYFKEWAYKLIINQKMKSYNKSNKRISKRYHNH